MGSKFINYISKAIIILIILIGIIFIFSLFSNAEDSESASEKNEQEIEYLDAKLLSLINYLNNINLENYRIVTTKVESESSSGSGASSDNSQEENSEEETNSNEKTISKMEEEKIVTDDSDIDWDTIEGELELLSSTWSTIVLDLYNINVSSEYILGFSNDLNQATLSVKNQDKTLSCMYLAKLYGYLPSFLDENSENDLKRDILEAKTYIVNAYAYTETENWDNIEEEVSKAENILASLVNDARYVDDQRKYNINKSYILVEELKNSLSTEDTGIFYVKYKNVLEELNILT